VFPCVTDEMGQTDQGQSDDIGIPVESQRDTTGQNCVRAKDASSTLFCFHVP